MNTADQPATAAHRTSTPDDVGNARCDTCQRLWPCPVEAARRNREAVRAVLIDLEVIGLSDADVDRIVEAVEWGEE